MVRKGTEALKETRRISIPVMIVSLLLAVLVTFMTTYTLLREQAAADLRQGCGRDRARRRK